MKKIKKFIIAALTCCMIISLAVLPSYASCPHIRESITCTNTVGTVNNTHFVMRIIGGVPSQVPCITTSWIRLFTKRCLDCNTQTGSGAGTCLITHELCSSQSLHGH
jgi:hypothetical protein